MYFQLQTLHILIRNNSIFLFPCGSAGKESACNAGDLGLIPGLGRSLGEGKGYPLQYFGLDNSMDCIVCGVTKSQTRLRDWIEPNLTAPTTLVAQLIKSPPAMWETWVGKIPWRRERLPTLVSWPGEFHRLYSPQGRKEWDMTERLSLSVE